MPDRARVVREITLRLSEIPSVNGSTGEAELVHYLTRRLAKLEAHADGRLRLHRIPSQGDPLARPSLLAHLAGRSSEAVLLLGHSDTVGTADYGDLEPLAVKPLELTERVAQGALGEEMARLARSGEWLFGRGVLDMKSGVAAAVALLEEMSQEEIPGHLLVAVVPDEEAGSVGARTLGPWLTQYAKESHLNLRAVVCTDFTSARSGDGGARHVYTGSIGKTLPAVYVQGLPSHVGEPEEGLDPSAVLAAITSAVCYNPLLAEVAEGETAPLPVSLMARDGKERYDVQTSPWASAYFNLFHIHRSAGDSFRLFEKTVREAVATFSRRIGKAARVTDLPVWTFEELVTLAGGRGSQAGESGPPGLEEVADTQMRARAIVQQLLCQAGVEGAAAVVYLAAPIIPRVVSGGHARGLVQEAVEAHDKRTGDRTLVERHFPYISDLSFLAMSPDRWDETVRLNSPVPDPGRVPPPEMAPLLVGPYGFGGHRRDERVHIPYSFEQLPILLRELTLRILTDTGWPVPENKGVRI